MIGNGKAFLEAEEAFFEAGEAFLEAGGPGRRGVPAFTLGNAVLV